ncbi:MAG TPA: hypothetical protein VJY39_09600 [Acidisphaera sp.]|nr:hypothetical protein [Acidisphaera sp.]
MPNRPANRTDVAGVQMPFQSFLPQLENFTYFPFTSWEKFWEQFFSPRFYFGCNVSDAETERHVLDQVGSYGSQLNTVLDAMQVLVRRLDGPKPLTDSERARITALVDLMERADDAAAQFQGKPRQMIPAVLSEWIQR